MFEVMYNRQRMGQLFSLDKAYSAVRSRPPLSSMHSCLCTSRRLSPASALVAPLASNTPALHPSPPLASNTPALHSLPPLPCTRRRPCLALVAAPALLSSPPLASMHSCLCTRRRLPPAFALNCMLRSSPTHGGTPLRSATGHGLPTPHLACGAPPVTSWVTTQALSRVCCVPLSARAAGLTAPHSIGHWLPPARHGREPGAHRIQMEPETGSRTRHTQHPVGARNRVETPAHAGSRWSQKLGKQPHLRVVLCLDVGVYFASSKLTEPHCTHGGATAPPRVPLAARTTWSTVPHSMCTCLFTRRQ